MTEYATIIRGTAFTSQTPTELNSLIDHIFCVDDAGLIARVVAPGEADFDALAADAFELKSGQYLLPGFVDLHVHAPQWAQTGTALDAPLYDWLNRYTFPLESRFSDIELAREVYTEVVDTLLAHGTTTVLYFGTVHVESSVELARICAERGQRGLVGKVVMDDPVENPHNCRDADAATAIADTERFIKAVQALPPCPQGVYPVVMPRFIPSCTDEALAGLGKLAADYDLHIHTHASESDWEHGHVLERFGVTDAEALDNFGLLTDKSILAHCTHLTDDDVTRFARTGAAIAHCPISNAYFAGAVLPLRRFRDAGVDIGLGSDLSGGYNPSLYANAVQAVTSSRMLADGVDVQRPADERGVGYDARLTLVETFYAATVGGGEALSLPIGRLEPGYFFDAQLVDTRTPGARLPHFGDEPVASTFEKIMHLTRPENIRRVWVAGRTVKNRED